jgi:GGDEF domain-containing protein
MNLPRRLFGKSESEPARQDPAALEQIKRQVEGVRRTVLYDGDIGLYQGWYFELRLREEAQRCDRYGLSFAVIAVRLLNLQRYDVAEDAWQRQASQAAYLAAKSVRTVDLAASIGAGEFAICLVHCDQAGAERAVLRLAEALRDHPCEIGISTYPEDKLDHPGMLVDLAFSRAQPYNNDRAAA